MPAAAQQKGQQGWFSPVVGPKRYSCTAGKPEFLKIWLHFDETSSFHGRLISSQNQSVGIIKSGIYQQ